MTLSIKNRGYAFLNKIRFNVFYVIMKSSKYYKLEALHIKEEALRINWRKPNLMGQQSHLALILSL